MASGDWVPTGGLLAVHAHPDDETLATGGLLAAWARAGLPVTVVTCTRGERGEVIGDELSRLAGDAEALSLHREGELAAALQALGVDRHVFLDRLPAPPPSGEDSADGHAEERRYQDSGMVWLDEDGHARAGAGEDVPDGAFVSVPVDEAAGRLAGLIRRLRPEAVVTYEPGGGYGHPDHVRAHEVTRRALRLAAEDGPTGVRVTGTATGREVGGGSGAGGRPGAGAGQAEGHEVPVRLWAVVAESEARAGLEALEASRDVAALRERHGLTVLPPSAPLPSVAVPDERVDLVLDRTPVADRVLRALRAHATQVRPVQELPARRGPSSTRDPEPGPSGDAAPGVQDTTLAQDIAGSAHDAPLLGCYALSNGVLTPLLRREHYVLDPDSPARPRGVLALGGED